MSSLSDSSILAGGSGAVDSVYSIDQSIRFNSDDNAHMDRTPSSAGNQKTWTWSAWVKRGKLGTRQHLFTAYNGNDNSVGMNVFRFQDDDTLLWSGYVTNWRKTSQVFRDTSAWYHIVLSVDTTEVVGSERQRIYINGERVSDFAASNDMSYDTAYSVNDNVAHAIGIGLGNQSSYDFDGYMAEIVLLDGTATDCNSFGEFNSSGIWIPKDVSDLNFGTNGFHITGSDTSGSPVKLGDDEAGSNNYTTSGMDASDQRSDSPTNNFATFNPLVASSDTFIYSEGNLKSLSNTSSWAFTGLSQSIRAGKYVIEFDVGPGLQSSSSVGVGMCTLEYFNSYSTTTTQDLLGQQPDSFLFRSETGTNTNTRMFIESSSAITTNSPTLGNNDRFLIYVDADNGKAWTGLYDSGTSTTNIYGSDFDTVGNPGTGANPTMSFTAGTEMMIFVQYYNGNGLTLENEPSKMVHSVVSGYKALNTSNLFTG